MRRVVVFLLFVLLLLAVRWGFWLQPSFGFFSSDDSVPLLMARHIAAGRSLPLFFYGQFYHGALAAYIYAALMTVVGFSARSLALINMIFFALGCGLLAAAMGPLKRTLWYFALPLPALIFVSTDTSVHFALVFLLSAGFIHVIQRLSRGITVWGLAAAGFSAGLLFWVYQGSLILTLPGLLILAVLSVRARKRIDGKVVVWGVLAAVSALAGMLPLLLSDLRNHFVTLKFAFSSSGSMPAAVDLVHWIGRFLANGAYNQYELKTAALSTPALLAPAAALLTLGGFLAWSAGAWKKRRGLALAVFPLLAVPLVAASKFGRLIAENAQYRQRYQVHSVILLPLALFFLAYGLYRLDAGVRGFLQRRGRRLGFPPALAAAFLLFLPFSLRINAGALEGGRQMNRLAGQLKRADLPHLFIGAYPEYFRFNALTGEAKLFVPLPFMPADNPFFTHIRYYPYGLEAMKSWESRETGLLVDPRRATEIMALLRRRHSRLKVRRVDLDGTSLLIYPPRTPLRLMNRDYLRMSADVEGGAVPAGLEFHERELRIRFASDARPLRYDHLSIQGRDSRLEIPLVANAPVYELPPEFTLNPRRVTLSRDGVSMRMIPVIRVQGAPPQGGLTVDPAGTAADMVYFHLKQRRSLSCRGLVVNRRLTIRVTDPGIRELEFRVTNPFPFESPLWQEKHVQEVRCGTRGPRLRLANGDNRFILPVTVGKVLILCPRYRSFFKVTDAAQVTDAVPVGFLIRRILARYRDGRVRDVTPLARNPFLEEHRRRLRARHGPARIRDNPGT